VPGSPDLAKVIFEKIHKAAIVIADATIVGKGKSGTRPNKKHTKARRFINPNVGIEIGYALKAHGDGRLLLIVNEHYGSTDDLPFDLRHKSVSFRYDLREDAEKEEIASAKKSLVVALVVALRQYIDTVPAAVENQQFNGWPAKRPPAFYFSAGERLVQIGQPGDLDRDFYFSANRALYVRLIPTRSSRKPWTPRELNDLTSDVQPLARKGILPLRYPNEYGQIHFRPYANQPEIAALTQVFSNGELWGLNGALMVDRQEGERLLPALLLEMTCYDALYDYVRVAEQRLGLSAPYAFEAGLVGASGYSISQDYGMKSKIVGDDPIQFAATVRSTGRSNR
jgi:hypothetical protein